MMSPLAMNSGTIIWRPVSSFASFQDEFRSEREGGAVSTTLSDICGGNTMFSSLPSSRRTLYSSFSLRNQRRSPSCSSLNSNSSNVSRRRMSRSVLSAVIRNRLPARPKHSRPISRTRIRPFAPSQAQAPGGGAGGALANTQIPGTAPVTPSGREVNGSGHTLDASAGNYGITLSSSWLNSGRARGTAAHSSRSCSTCAATGSS